MRSKLKFPNRTNNFFNSPQDFVSMKLEGEGAFSKVYHVIHKETRKSYGLKKVLFTSSNIFKFRLFKTVITPRST